MLHFASRLLSFVQLRLKYILSIHLNIFIHLEQSSKDHNNTIYYSIKRFSLQRLELLSCTLSVHVLTTMMSLVLKEPFYVNKLHICDFISKIMKLILYPFESINILEKNLSILHPIIIQFYSKNHPH